MSYRPWDGKTPKAAVQLGPCMPTSSEARRAVGFAEAESCDAVSAQTPKAAEQLCRIGRRLISLGGYKDSGVARSRMLWCR